MARKKFYVTTPIYYVNDVPHIGHAYTTIAADILARYNRMMGREVFFLTGTDEHGQKVQKAAAERSRTPQEHADLMVENFRSLWKKLNVSNDAFIRTTDAEHVGTVQEIIRILYEKGEIVKREYAGWYCTPDERFWTEKEIVEGNCPDCGRPVEKIQEENYFFLMSRYQKRLIRYIEDNPLYIQPETRKNEVLGFLKNNELGDLCITRPASRLSWGVPIPFDEDFVTYVWFDALLNYFSATFYLAPQKTEVEGAGDTNQKDSFNSKLITQGSNYWWPADHHIVGKDILTTHAVYWSTMLMALGLPLPANIFAHGWWTVDGRKMSKSLGNVVDPVAVTEKYGVDAFRYFIFREVPFGLDGDFSEEALINRINTDLANDLGNLLSRTLTMIVKYRDGNVPIPSAEKERAGMEKKIRAWFDSGNPDSLGKIMEQCLRNLQFNIALQELWRLTGDINEYIASSEPWKEKDDERLSTILYTLAEALRLIALYLYPFMPESAGRIWSALGIEADIGGPRSGEDFHWGGLRPGSVVRKGKPLFPRIEKKESEKGKGRKMSDEENKAASRPSKTEGGASKSDNLISINEFAKVQLKIGKVLGAERVEGSNKLIKLQVDTGETRQIVAGIAKVYAPDDLVGRKIVVVTNLKPARLMGVESQGMLLAATDDSGDPVILVPEKDVKEGAGIK